MTEYGIVTIDPKTGDETVIYSKTGEDGLEFVKRYLPNGDFYDAAHGVEYRVVERDVSEWRRISE